MEGSYVLWFELVIWPSTVQSFCWPWGTGAIITGSTGWKGQRKGWKGWKGWTVCNHSCFLELSDHSRDGSHLIHMYPNACRIWIGQGFDDLTLPIDFISNINWFLMLLLSIIFSLLYGQEKGARNPPHHPTPSNHPYCWFPGNPKQPPEQWKKTWLFRVYRGVILPSYICYMGIVF